MLRSIREQLTVRKCLMRDCPGVGSNQMCARRVEHPVKHRKHRRQLFWAILMIYCRTMTQGKLFWLAKGLQPILCVVFFM